jgi:hypothetical protein
VFTTKSVPQQVKLHDQPQPLHKAHEQMLVMTALTIIDPAILLWSDTLLKIPHETADATTVTMW